MFVLLSLGVLATFFLKLCYRKGLCWSFAHGGYIPLTWELENSYVYLSLGYHSRAILRSWASFGRFYIQITGFFVMIVFIGIPTFAWHKEEFQNCAFKRSLHRLLFKSNDSFGAHLLETLSGLKLGVHKLMSSYMQDGAAVEEAVAACSCLEQNSDPIRLRLMSTAGDVE